MTISLVLKCSKENSEAVLVTKSAESYPRFSIHVRIPNRIHIWVSYEGYWWCVRTTALV